MVRNVERYHAYAINCCRTRCRARPRRGRMHRRRRLVDHTANSPSDSSWRMILPLGSGGHPDEPGSNDSPKWTPGKLPVTMQPILAFNGDLWMTSQTNAWSSSNGRLAALHKDRHGKPHLGRQAILQGSSVVVRRYGVQPARAGQ